MQVLPLAGSHDRQEFDCGRHELNDWLRQVARQHQGHDEDRQGAEHVDAFERRVVHEVAVTQCYRVAPGPDFILMLRVRDMPGYQALAERLFTQDANVRNVRVFFSVRRAKFQTQIPLSG